MGNETNGQSSGECQPSMQRAEERNGTFRPSDGGAETIQLGRHRKVGTSGRRPRNPRRDGIGGRKIRR